MQRYSDMNFVSLGFVLILTGIVGAFEAIIPTRICFDVSPHLLPCSLKWAQRKRADNIPLLNMKDDNENIVTRNGGVTVIYKLIGCIPSGLPLSLPKCRTQDYLQAQRVVEVPFIFPEVDATQWWRFIKNHRNELSITDQMRNFHVNEVVDDSLVKLIKRRNDILYPSPKDSSDRKYHQYYNEVDVNERLNKNPRRSRSDPTNYGIEFPYNEAIPFDPEKHWMLLHHRPEEIQYERDVSIVPKKLNSQHEAKDTPTILRRRRLIEFPYAKAIPFDPKKHSMLLNKLEDHHEIPLVPLNSLRLRNIPNSDVINPIDSDALNHLNQFKDNQRTDCEMSTKRKREATGEERKVVLDDWNTSEIRLRLAGQFRRKIPTRTMRQLKKNGEE